MGKRYRACEGCHRLKIKCEGADGAAACERCARNNLECVPAAPRLQRDRIQQLEAEIQELKDALRVQQGGGSGSGSVSGTGAGSSGASVSVSASGSGSATPGRSPGGFMENREHDHAVLSFLDARIPLTKQQDLLHLFAHQAGAAWPVVRLPRSLDRLRSQSPLLLLSVLAYTVVQKDQSLELEVHDELVRETTYMLGEEVVGRGQRSLELVQALLVSVFWSKTTRRGDHVSCYQLLPMAVDMAIDLGIAGPTLMPSPAAYFSRYDDPGSSEARRTWLACFVALSTWSMSLRRPSTISWNAYHDECLHQLEREGESSDVLFCQIVRMSRLIQEIAARLRLCQLAADFLDGNDQDTHAVMETLKIKVDEWAAQVPASLASSQTLQVWHHLAMIHIYEPVLHTPTNKSSFAAPFIPGRIAVKDIPRPMNLLPSLRGALESIIRNCHAVIDTAADMEPALVLGLPSFSFAPTLLYALFVLVTTFVAATDPANTYGQCVTREGLGIDKCGLRLRSLTARLVALDPTMSSFTTRFIDATSWLETWYNDYMVILSRYEGSVAGLTPTP